MFFCHARTAESTRSVDSTCSLSPRGSSDRPKAAWRPIASRGWVGWAAVALLGCFGAAADAADRPNVVVLLADDLGGQDIGCYGGPVNTPVLDQLAEAGVRMSTFYSGAPVCSTARAALLTGRQPLRTGVYTVIQDHLHDMHLLRREITIAEHLKDRGYQTAHVGKWHLGTPFRGRDKPWIDEHGFDHWFATDLNAAPSHRNPINFWRNRERVGPLDGYACQLVVDEAIRWLDDRGDTDAPFFLNVWFHEPHAPIAAPANLVKKYGDVDDPAAVYSATIENTDRAIGRLIEQLRSSGKLKNTLIIYTSDHGSYRPERNGDRKGAKGSLYEGGIRTPGIFFWPEGIPGQRIINEPGGAVDLLPTICGLTKIDLPANVTLDGTDLSGLLTGDGGFRRRVPLYWVSPTSQPMVVVRDDRFTLVGRRAAEYPKDQKRITELLADMKSILLEELPKEQRVGPQDLWRHAWNFESSREDWRKLRGEFVTLNTFQESWCPLIKSGSGGLNRFELYDLQDDPNQTRDVSFRHPREFALLKQRAIRMHERLIDEAVDWSDAAVGGNATAHSGEAESPIHVHRLESSRRSVFDAFAYVNRIPVEREADESPLGLSGRILGRLANQEGRVLVKLPPGMNREAYAGFRIALTGRTPSQNDRCFGCHHLPAMGHGGVDPVATFRNGSYSRERWEDLVRNETHKAIPINDNELILLHAFLKTLSDLPDTEFRKEILNAKLLEFTGEN